MSLSKQMKATNPNEWIVTEMKNKNRNYSKDSFDRFSEDLSQLLLSYLSFEEKFNFECVSKQWKHSVFNKQQKLVIKKFIYGKCAQN
jgi:hypothetical protein